MLNLAPVMGYQTWLAWRGGDTIGRFMRFGRYGGFCAWSRLRVDVYSETVRDYDFVLGGRYLIDCRVNPPFFICVFFGFMLYI